MIKSLAKKLFYSCANDLSIVYGTHFIVHRRLPDLKHQRSFSDRMAFRRLFPQPAFGPLTDKVQARDYVKDRLGEAFLIPVYGITSDIENFSFEDLPSSFVMKASHGCGWNELVRDKAATNLEDLRRKARNWLAQNFYDLNRERHYRDIPARILFEKLLTDQGGTPKDYKIHCFRKGEKLTQIAQVHSDRFGDHRVNFFSTDWTPLKISHGYSALPSAQLPRPENFHEMLAAAEALSEGFNYVRIDFYSLEGRIYFGEMTFTPGAGLLRFDPVEMDEKWAPLFDPDQSYFGSVHGEKSWERGQPVTA